MSVSPLFVSAFDSFAPARFAPDEGEFAGLLFRASIAVCMSAKSDARSEIAVGGRRII